jgi:hypothetical protein
MGPFLIFLLTNFGLWRTINYVRTNRNNELLGSYGITEKDEWSAIYIYIYIFCCGITIFILGKKEREENFKKKKRNRKKAKEAET